MGKISYRLVQRKNPLTKDYLYYATNVQYSNIGEKDIVKYAAESSCIEAATIKSVMSAWQQVMRMYFTNGHNVICHPLGSFVSTIKSKLAASEDDWNASYIRGLYLRFRPGTELRFAKANKNNSFVRVSED